MKKFKSIIATMLVGAMMLTTACGTTTNTTGSTSTDAPATTDGGTELKIAKLNNNSEPGTLHPSLSQGTHESWLLDHMFKGLYTKTPGGVPELAAAEEVNISEDGLTWTFKLRDAKWSTGNPVTANDFVAAFSYTLDPNNASKYAANMYVLENGEAINKGEKDVAELGAKAIDDKTLEIKLITPLPYFPDLLTNTFFYPIDKVNAEANPQWFMSPDNFSSNGPFVLTTWKPKELFILSKNQNYYNVDKTKLDEVHFSVIEDQTTEWQLYEQGQQDLIYAPLPDVIETLKTSGSTELSTEDDLSTYYYYLNTTVAPLNNVKVRRALAMAINRQDLIDNVTKGGQTPAYSLTPVGVKDETGKDFADSLGQLFTEDLDEARKLLNEGLAEEGFDINTWSFTLLYNTNDVHKKVAEAIQNMWAVNLGVNCQLENAEFQTVLDRRHSGDFDVCRAGWIGDYADPMTFDELFTSYSEYNDSDWANPKYDELIGQALLNTDVAGRMEQLREAERLLIDEMPLIPIYFYSKNIITKPYLVDVYTPINKYPNVEFADIVK